MNLTLAPILVPLLFKFSESQGATHHMLSAVTPYSRAPIYDKDKALVLLILAGKLN